MLPTRLGHFEFKTLRQSWQGKKPPRILLYPQATPKAIPFFSAADWEKEIARNFSHREFFCSLVQARGSLPIWQESHVQASNPEDTALATFCVATSSNPEPQVKSETLTYVQRPRLVGPSVRVLGKPSPKRGRAGSVSDWQALEECARKHLKSS
jgi:hypothetical protein